MSSLPFSCSARTINYRNLCQKLSRRISHRWAGQAAHPGNIFLRAVPGVFLPICRASLQQQAEKAAVARRLRRNQSRKALFYRYFESAWSQPFFKGPAVNRK